MLLACFFTFLVLMVISGCETNGLRSKVDSTVDTRVNLKAARMVKKGGTSRRSGLGSGASMEPLYTENTVLVINPIDFSDLSAGMIVAYRSDKGEQTVHRLAYKSGNSWIAVGINNATYDPTPVTAENLIGVVYAVFYSAQGDK